MDRLNTIVEQSRTLSERLDRVQAELSTIRETAESDDGLVTVTVDMRGRITELKLDPRVFRSPDSVALARTITDTAAVAADLADRRALALATPILEGSVTPEPARTSTVDDQPGFAPLIDRLRNS